MLIPLTQYKMPDGREIPTSCEIRDDLESKYKSIAERGLKLTCEVLMTGEVSLTISNDEEDYDLELATNGPGENSPRVCLEKMIARFDGVKYDKRELIEDSAW